MQFEFDLVLYCIWGGTVFLLFLILISFIINSRRIASLENKIQVLDKNNDDLSKSCNALSLEREALARKLASLTGSFKAVGESNDALIDNIAELSKRIISLEGKLGAVKGPADAVGASLGQKPPRALTDDMLKEGPDVSTLKDRASLEDENRAPKGPQGLLGAQDLSGKNRVVSQHEDSVPLNAKGTLKIAETLLSTEELDMMSAVQGFGTESSGIKEEIPLGSSSASEERRHKASAEPALNFGGKLKSSNDDKEDASEETEIRQRLVKAMADYEAAPSRAAESVHKAASRAAISAYGIGTPKSLRSRNRK